MGVSSSSSGFFNITPGLRLTLAILSVLAVFFIGSAGYMIIEVEHHPSFLDAAYMTVITLSTVGYGEVWPQSPTGKIWTIGVITFGIATVSVAVTSLIALFIGGDLRVAREKKKMHESIGKLRQHTILCGFGRMGEMVADELRAAGKQVVIIEMRPEIAGELRAEGFHFVIGDATEDTCLLEAGLAHASVLVAMLPHDADNVFITLTARALQPDLSIITRAEQPSTEGKLLKAGATRVVCPQQIGANRIASVLLRPNVADFIDMAHRGVDLEMSEYQVSAASMLVGKSLRDVPLRKEVGATIVAIIRSHGKTTYNPDADAKLESGDCLIFVGPAGASERLDSL